MTKIVYIDVDIKEKERHIQDINDEIDRLVVLRAKYRLQIKKLLELRKNAT